MNEIVIKIDDKLHEQICSDAEIMIYGGMRSGKTLLATLLRAVRNGKVLPKGHGRLIDADAFIGTLDASDRDIYCEQAINEDAPTLVEADKEV